MRRRDPRLAAVPWRDLLVLRRAEVVGELLISLPWLLASCLLAAGGLWLPALACSFLFFLTGLRQVHNGFHLALGLSARATDWLLFVMSQLMLGSMHAVKINHLLHHRHCLGEDDLEAASARWPAWRAIMIGPLFPWRLHRKAWRVGNPTQRRWMAAELAGNAALFLLAFGWLEQDWLRYHLLAMAVGQCWTSFFAVWTVHHDCADDGPISRTQRGRWLNRASYAMFLHTEHHLFPKVPTRHLPELARRLDAVAPEYAGRQVLDFGRAGS